MILEVTCSDYGIIQFVRIFKIVFQMIQIIGPILAIVSLGMIFLSSVAASDEKAFETNKKKIRNCLLALVITFFLPVFVNLVMSATFMSNTFEVSSCWKAADSYKPSAGNYISKTSNKKKTDTFIINPNAYKGTDGDPNASIRGENGGEINSAASNSLKESLVNLAIAQKKDSSAKGGRKYWSFMGYKSRVAWCACFVSWNVHHAEYNGQKVSSILSHKGAGCTSWISFCKRNKKTTWHQGNSFTPSKGDLILFDWNGGGEDHIGIVADVKGNTIHTIEGNSGDRVRSSSYPKNSRKIYGYCSW